MPTFHIHIMGQVQGVGFRPFVYNLARSEGLVGWVNNSLDGVHIRINSRPDKAKRFYSQVLKNAPGLSIITAHNMSEVGTEQFTQFEIRHSGVEGQPNLLLTPDFALCSPCRKELLHLNNRRFGYPFITCTNCGPRYSIVTSLPYDRASTTMTDFLMCPTCMEEYHAPTDRRYFSQTNSCDVCGIQLSLFDRKGTLLTNKTEEALADCVIALESGQIAAVKGIGGYLILADATNTNAIACLRKRKHRSKKPFAVLYPNLELLQKDVYLSPPEIEALCSPQAPIVLLTAKDHLPSGLQLEAIAPDLQRVGAMLPYTPLYELLLQKLKRPLVATSGNVSGTPIVFQDQKAVKDLPAIADFILLNNREIAVPQDDSVILFTKKEQRAIIIRRSRGMAPSHIEAGANWPAQTVLSMGAFLKSSFTLLHQRNSFISQYLGKLDYLETQEHFKHTLQHFLHLFGAKVEQIIMDEHPAYYSSQMGKELAVKWEVPWTAVQHHKAHFGAVLAENDLVDSKSPVLGIIWDGTGLGTDGQIWGGEFFTYKNGQISRFNHLKYFPWILQDKMAEEPRLSALAACYEIPEAASILKNKFTATEWKIYSKLLSKPILWTSSIGRLFDAVVSLLDLLDISSYEGQAGMLLEQLARKSVMGFELEWKDSYLYGFSLKNGIPVNALLSNLIFDIQKNSAKDLIAAKFHFSLIHAIKAQVDESGINKIAFSGGVWQNGLLVDMAIHYLSGEAELYFHRQLSPNDECISYGGLICWLMDQ